MFPKFHSVPLSLALSKLLTFYRKGPFVLTARYADPDVANIQRSDSLAQFHIVNRLVVSLQRKPRMVL